MATADIIPNLITATSNEDVYWMVDDFTKTDAERTYTCILNTPNGSYIIHLYVDYATLNDHNGEPLMGNYTNSTNITSLRDAIATVKSDNKIEALGNIDTYLAGLVGA